MKEIRHPRLPGPGRLYAGPCPAPPFDESVRPLARSGITTVICLLEPHELPADLTAAYGRVSLELVGFPIRDYDAPDDAAALAGFLADLIARLSSGQRLYLHCLGGIGRTGTVLACLLKTLGVVEEDPVRLVRAIYSPLAVESLAQRRFVRDFTPPR